MTRRASTPAPVGTGTEPDAGERATDNTATTEPTAPADLPADDTATVEVTDDDAGTGEPPRDETVDMGTPYPSGAPVGDERIDAGLDHADDDPPGGRRPIDEDPETGPRQLSPEERAGDTRGDRQADDEGERFQMQVTRGTFTYMDGQRRVSAFPGEQVTLDRSTAERGLRLGVLQESAPDTWE